MFAYCGNNPINFNDHSGYDPITIGIGLLVAAIACVVAAIVPPPSFSKSTSISYPTQVKIPSAKEVATKVVVSAAVAAVKTQEQINCYSVYTLSDADGEVQYVGRTKDVDARKAAHARSEHRKGLNFNVEHSNLSYPAARGIEQTYMLYYHTINTANKMNNQINGVGLSNPKLNEYLVAAKGSLGYLWNQISNDVLNWSEM